MIDGTVGFVPEQRAALADGVAELELVEADPGERAAVAPDSDPVEHPAHYTAHPSGIECIEVTEHFGFCIGNAVKYLWRAGLKGDAVEDLRKARWYVDREIERLTKKG